MVYYPMIPCTRHPKLCLLITIALTSSLLFNKPQRSYATLGDCATSRCYFFPNVFLNYPLPIRTKDFLYGRTTRSNALGIFGHIENIGQTPVYGASVRIRAYDQANNLLATQNFPTVFSATLPGQDNFVLGHLEVSASQVVTSDVSIAEFSWQSNSKYVSQTITFSPSLSAGGAVGDIFNSQPVTISNIIVAVSTGCGVYTQEILGPIKPSDHLTFTRYVCFYDLVPGAWPPELLGEQAKFSP